MQFEFVQDLENLDHRSVFANRIFKLLYQKHNGNLHFVLMEAIPFFEELEELVRNIYELVEEEIPLYAYHNLITHGADNWGFTEDEYNNALQSCISACILYYSQNK